MMPYFLLSLAPLFWAGNWIVGRAMHESVTPFGLNFGRWSVALIILALVLTPRWRTVWPAIARAWVRLMILAACGTVIFHSLIYTGLKFTTAVNAVLLNSFAPMFVLLASWIAFRESPTPRQFAGMAISFAGVLAIVARGDPGTLLDLEINPGDGLILLAMPFWAVYSVLLKRWQLDFGAVELLAGMSLMAVLLLAPAVAAEAIAGTAMRLDTSTLGAILYIGVFASAIAYLCWNKGVERIGPNRAGFFIHLLPAFGAVLAVVFLGESFHPYHAVGIAFILGGVTLAATERARIAGTSAPNR